jgi:hypothetical protein
LNKYAVKRLLKELGGRIQPTNFDIGRVTPMDDFDATKFLQSMAHWGEVYYESLILIGPDATRGMLSGLLVAVEDLQRRKVH